MILDVVQSGPPQTIAKLVNITPISLWFMVLITIVIGAYNHESLDWFSWENLNRKPMGFYHEI